MNSNEFTCNCYSEKSLFHAMKKKLRKSNTPKKMTRYFSFYI